MTAEPTEELIERWLAAGVVSEQTAADLRAFEAERAAAALPAVGAASRVADVGAYLGAALVVSAALVIAFARFADQSGAQIAVLGIVGAAALAAAVVSRRAGLAVASDALAGASVLLLPICWAVVLSELGEGGDQRLGWLLVSGGAVLLGGLLGLLVGSRLAAVVAAIGLVAMPLALVMSGNDERAVFDDVLGDSVSAGWVWAAIALMAVAAGVAVVSAERWARRGWLTRETVFWTTLAASVALGLAMWTIAAVRDAVGFDFVLLAGALLATGLALWRRDRVWLPAAVVALLGAGWSALDDPADYDARLALALVVLALSGLPFLPLVRRVPRHWMVLAWEAAVWLVGMGTAVAFAFERDGWPALGGAWALAMIVVAAVLRRWLALGIGVLGAYIILLTVVIDAFEASIAAGFGTLAFGALVLVAVIVWRRRPAGAPPS